MVYLTTKRQHEEHHCDNRIILYFDCSGGFRDLHM